MRRLKFRALSFTEDVVAELRDVVGSHACGSMGDEVRRRVRRWWNPDPAIKGRQCHLRFFFGLLARVAHQRLSTHVSLKLTPPDFASAVLHLNPPAICPLLRLEVDQHQFVTVVNFLS